MLLLTILNTGAPERSAPSKSILKKSNTNPDLSSELKPRSKSLSNVPDGSPKSSKALFALPIY